MNEFMKMLKKQNVDGKIDTEKFTQMLIDEEYLVNGQLQTCYFCGNENFDIMVGGRDVYEYIGNRMQNIFTNNENTEKAEEEVHNLGLLCNWLNFHGIPIFKDAEKFPKLSLIFCKNCGRVLGIKLDTWYYPYCGYFDNVKELSSHICFEVEDENN